jgi:uncharacterized protein HemX
MRVKFWKRDEPQPAAAGADSPNTPAAGTPAGTPPTAGKAAAPAPTTEERIEALSAWVAQVDRKLGIRTFALGAAVVLALASGIVGVVLAVNTKDESATKDEVAALRDQVEATTREATQAAEESVQSLSGQVDALEQRLSTLNATQRTSDKELSVVQDDIDDIRNQISRLQSSGGTATSPDERTKP